jgi:hypothetical protein
MMKNIKDITISIFAVIGFVAIITAFTNQPEQASQILYGTPESHVWEFSDGMPVSGRPKIYKLNKVTGEVILVEGERSRKIE